MSADEFRKEPPTDRWPPDFESWPLDKQLRQVTMRMTRKGIIDACLSHAALDAEEYEIQDDSKLEKELFAAIYLTLEGFNHE